MHKLVKSVEMDLVRYSSHSTDIVVQSVILWHSVVVKRTHVFTSSVSDRSPQFLVAPQKIRSVPF